jgi:signal transduction histidine kinase
MNNISLTEKLVLYFLLIGIGIISLVSLYAFYSTKNALMNRTFDQLTSLRLVKKNQVETFFSDRLKDLDFLSNSNDTRELVSMLNESSTHTPATKGSGLLSAYSAWLNKYHMLGTYFDAAYLISMKKAALKGRLAGQETPSFVHDAAFADSLVSRFAGEKSHPKGFLGDMSSDPESHRPILYIAGPVYGGNQEIEGLLLLEVSVEAINRIMLTNNPKSGLGMTGETYLVGSDYKLRSSSRFISNSILNTTVRTQPAIKAFNGEEGHITTRDYRNIPVLSSYCRISVPNLNWVILAEIDQKEAMIPIYRMRNSLLIISALLSIICFVIVFITARRITKPIIDLRDAAIRVGQGHYDTDLPVRSNDEIGALTQAFSTMSSQVKEKTRELQSERIGRLRSVIDAEETERQRLSREIHDGIGQSLIALKLRLESLLYIDGPAIRENINVLMDQFDGTVDEIRRISNNLMPSVLEVFGITIALRNLCDETMEHAGVKIRYETSGDLESMNTKTKTYIFRIAQEAFNNIIKHSGAKEVGMKLERIGENINFTIRDDGKGFDVGSVAYEKGNGLHNMNERVALMEGTIRIKSEINQGTEINIQIPVF